MEFKKQNTDEFLDARKKFYCGVVEGFYGCPWTTEQRRTLFERMQEFQLDTYLYAPKDDCKHRVYWRDLYSVEEADHLTGLIKEASDHDVTFVYALSPGLDMTYSNAKELTCLKRKLEQVASFGCKAFALLFDDIDVDMSEADKSLFQSFAQAQVSVTNEVYQYLSQPDIFLFCPTEYCSSRAVPDVEQSEYLNTIGTRLLPGIDIMWTGQKVISKTLTVEHIESLTSVLRRAPVIWDNIHANDYDQKRLFLGAYDGRSSALIPRLRGVMTNPNCEFEANFIAMHTLAQWSRSYRGQSSEAEYALGSSPVQSVILLEKQGDIDCVDRDALLSSSYLPKDALHNAINDWLPLFAQEKSASTRSKLPQPVITAPENPTPTPQAPVVLCNDKSPNESYMQPSGIGPVNSLIDSATDSGADSADERVKTEPMEIVMPADVTVASAAHTVTAVAAENATPSGYDSGCADCSVLDDSPKLELMQVEPTATASKAAEALRCEQCVGQHKSVVVAVATPSGAESTITCEDLHLLVELFYMPFEHGRRACELLNELAWLKLNCSCLYEAKSKQASEPQRARAAEWRERADNFGERLHCVDATLVKLTHMPNKRILRDLFSYIWDMRTILSLVRTFVDWLASGTVNVDLIFQMQHNPYTWSNCNYSEAFESGCQEPWVFRGGLQAEFQRVLPLDGAGDLLIPVVPQRWDAPLLTVRPYSPRDEAAVYDVCRRTCDDGLDATDIFPSHPELAADKLVGAFLTTTPDFCFVLEEEATGRVCGYAVAACDARDFNRKFEMAWLPAMQEKYPKPASGEHVQLSPAHEMINSAFYSHEAFAPDDLVARFPSLMRVDVLHDCCAADPTAFRRLVAASLMALRAHGSQGVHTHLHVGDNTSMERYQQLHFFSVPLNDKPDDAVLYGRAI